MHGAQFQGGVNVSAPLYDGGHTRDMTDYRTHLAEVAKFGEVSAQEQVALQTVSLALDRSRYTVEAQVYDQYARKMGCLVDALQQIVTADRGRTSELVQARKTQQQAELSRDQVLSQKRLTEIRLRRFVGDDLPPTEGITSVMLDTPALPDLITMASRASEIQALDSQAAALDAYVRAVLDGQKPQLGVLVAATKSAGAGDSRSVSGGLTFNWQLFNAANNYTTELGAQARRGGAPVSARTRSRSRKYRMAEVHEQAAARDGSGAQRHRDPAQQRAGAQLHAAAVAAARPALAVRRDGRRGRPLQHARAVRGRAVRHAAVQRAAVVAGPGPGVHLE